MHIILLKMANLEPEKELRDVLYLLVSSGADAAATSAPAAVLLNVLNLCGKICDILKALTASVLKNS